MANSTKQSLTPKQQEALLGVLKLRFEQNMQRHRGLKWAQVEARLELNPEKMWSLNEMEATGGEPDVVGYDESTGEFMFYDCAVESPVGRRSLCYDPAALAARRENKPKNSAMGMALEMGIELLSEQQYRELQQTGNFDTKTSSWIAAPEPIRRLGGAIFGDRRYGQVFVYHNGVESYYAGRGFRGALRI